MRYLCYSSFFLLLFNSIHGDPSTAPATKSTSQPKTFTGRVSGNHVRMRISPDTESTVVQELNRGDLLLVTGEKNGFYLVEPPENLKAYIFRSLVIDGVVEGNRVNVRLNPDLEAPAIATLSQGDLVHGEVAEENSKWLKIKIPSKTRFYVAKEFLDYVGGADFRDLYESRKKDLLGLIESSLNYTSKELAKPFQEINYDRVVAQLKTIVDGYRNEFPVEIEKIEIELKKANDLYLQKKVAYLEAKTSQLQDLPSALPRSQKEGLTEKMKRWEPFEEALFREWSSGYIGKRIEDFYQEELSTRAVKIVGTLELFSDPIHNKPGEFLIRHRDVPLGYAYSTLIDLDNKVGKEIQMVAIPRPNNNFAFPAYFIFKIEG